VRVEPDNVPEPPVPVVRRGRGRRRLVVDSHRGAHPQWCRRDVRAEFLGVEHLSRAHEWRPVYEHEVAIVDRLRQVVYPDGGAEIPTASVRIDNPWRPGEVALAAEDLTALVDRLLRLRDELVARRGDRLD
jgi:hypothetical protein